MRAAEPKNIRVIHLRIDHKMNKIIDEINKLALQNVNLLALVTKTSFDVVFFASVDGKMVQSNALAEKGVINFLELDKFYQTVAEIIRGSGDFKSDMLNVVKINDDKDIVFSYEPLNCRVHSIKKAWKETLGN